MELAVKERPDAPTGLLKLPALRVMVNDPEEADRLPVHTSMQTSIMMSSSSHKSVLVGSMQQVDGT